MGSKWDNIGVKWVQGVQRGLKRASNRKNEAKLRGQKSENGATTGGEAVLGQLQGQRGVEPGRWSKMASMCLNEPENAQKKCS